MNTLVSKFHQARQEFLSTYGKYPDHLVIKHPSVNIQGFVVSEIEPLVAYIDIAKDVPPDAKGCIANFFGALVFSEKADTPSMTLSVGDAITTVPLDEEDFR